MVVFRFMNTNDLFKFMQGEKLINTRDHSKDAKTNSKGFCFLDHNEYKPEDACHFLTGITDMDVCAVFETKKKLNKTYGIYADSSRNKELRDNGVSFEDWFNLFLEAIDPSVRKEVKRTEYCTTELSKDDFKLLRYAKPEFMKDDWKWIEYE